MNRSERDELLRFLQPLMRTRATDKDFAAETLIVDACARQPDALYLLVQRAMALQSALGAAQARIAELTAARGTEGEPGIDRDRRGEDRGDGRGAGASAGAWSRGLRSQVASVAAVGTGVGLGVAAGVTAGVLAGGLLLNAIEGIGGDADAVDGLAGGDVLGGLLDGLS